MALGLENPMNACHAIGFAAAIARTMDGARPWAIQVTLGDVQLPKHGDVRGEGALRGGIPGPA